MEIAELLIKNGANIDSRNNDGFTALQLCAFYSGIQLNFSQNYRILLRRIEFFFENEIHYYLCTSG